MIEDKPEGRTQYILGIEGSANKIGIGIVDFQGTIYSNPRETFITPPGTGFLPRETAEHHAQNIIPLIKKSLAEAGLTLKDICTNKNS